MIRWKEQPMRRLAKYFGIVMAIVASASVARANPLTDVQIFVSNGKLTTTKSLYDGFFFDFETTDPGFANALSRPALPTGEDYGFAVAGKLWYHSGIQGDPVSVAPGNPFIRIGDEFTNLIVSQTSGPQPGLQLASPLSGSLHVHPPYTLLGEQRPAGVYGLVLQITSPSFTASDPFVVALTNDPGFSLTETGVRYGEQQIVSAALVPEPGTGSLAVLGTAVATVGFGLRRLNVSRRCCKRVPSGS